MRTVLSRRHNGFPYPVGSPPDLGGQFFTPSGRSFFDLSSLSLGPVGERRKEESLEKRKLRKRELESLMMRGLRFYVIDRM